MLLDGVVRRTAMAIEVAAARRLFSREEYHRMGEVGILKRSDHVELIYGEIVRMSPMGSRHFAFVANLTHLLAVRLDERAVVCAQLPLVLTEYSEPEPDLAIYRRRPTIPYKERLPHAEDALLVIEVAESSLAYDRSTKLKLYAEAGIPEYWVVDCLAESVDIYRAPDFGVYRDVSRVEGAASVSPQAFPDVLLPLAKIFA
jgi:Uma2 family endonuclease